jgi:pseudouridine-5'-phosphate glycosidase
MLGCKHADIKVFATGGIGGVHRDAPFDISADLQALATIPMIVVCAGAKAILDLPATLEYLETMSVPVVGYGTDEFPAFYSRKSRLDVSVKLDTPQEIVDFAKAHWSMGLHSAVLVANPVPEADAIPTSEMEPFIAQANKEAHEKGIHGQELTPFLLQRITELTHGKSMRANLSLLLNNARLAAQIATAWRMTERRRQI